MNIGRQPITNNQLPFFSRVGYLLTAIILRWQQHQRYKDKMEWSGVEVFLGGLTNLSFFNALILNWKWHYILTQLFSKSSLWTFGGPREHFSGVLQDQRYFHNTSRISFALFQPYSLKNVHWSFLEAMHVIYMTSSLWRIMECMLV